MYFCMGTELPSQLDSMSPKPNRALVNPGSDLARGGAHIDCCPTRVYSPRGSTVSPLRGGDHKGGR